MLVGWFVRSFVNYLTSDYVRGHLDRQSVSYTENGKAATTSISHVLNVMPSCKLRIFIRPHVTTGQSTPTTNLRYINVRIGRWMTAGHFTYEWW